MKTTYSTFALLLITLSTSIFASDASFQELICETESKWTVRENSIYRESLKIVKDVDHYLNIADEIEPLQEKSKAIVKKNCLAGKDYKEIAPEIKKLWTEGCAPIVNGPLNIVCMKFMTLNDGSNIEKMLKENPALAELIKRAQNSGSVDGCSPEVSTNSVGKEIGLKESLKKEKLKSENEKQ